MKTTPRVLVLFVLFGMMLSMAPSAHAILAGVGPTDPATGYPSFYRDTNGVALQLCSLRGFCAVDPTGAEAFYFLARAKVRSTTGPSALVTLAVEAAYATPTGLPKPGRQITFSRERILIDNLPVPGVYTVTHPYGTRSFNVQPDIAGNLSIKFTRDMGIRAGLFTGALNGPIGPFLQQVKHPVGFLGNVNFERRVTGGPNGNVLTVTGPTGVVINQPLWAVQGQIQ